MSTRGRITNEYVVWCGECGNWDRQVGPRGEAVRIWKKAGWKNTRKYGWLCVVCSDNMERSERKKT